MNKHLRNKVNSVIKYKKSTYYSRKVEQAVNSKETWKQIRSIGVGNKASNTTYNIDPNELNNVFVNIPFISADSDFYRNVGNVV